MLATEKQVMFFYRIWNEPSFAEFAKISKQYARQMINRAKQGKSCSLLRPARVEFLIHFLNHEDEIKYKFGMTRKEAIRLLRENNELIVIRNKEKLRQAIRTKTKPQLPEQVVTLHKPLSSGKKRHKKPRKKREYKPTGYGCHPSELRITRRS